MQIRIDLPKNRYNPGRLAVVDDNGETAFVCDCLGKADNQRAARADNPDRDPTLPYGDTPTGTYETTQITMFAERHRSLGDGWIVLEGTGGDALTAAEKGRTGLGIHAGRGDDRLVPTYGCVRVLDRDFKMLTDLLYGERFSVVISESSG